MIKNGEDTACKSKIDDKFFESKYFFLKDRTFALKSLRHCFLCILYIHARSKSGMLYNR